MRQRRHRRVALDLPAPSSGRDDVRGMDRRFRQVLQQTKHEARRTGDADIASLPRAATLPARVASPALGLRGFYRSKVTTAGGQPKLADQDFGVDTFCLRAGDRCLSRFVLTDFSDHQLFIYANQAWTENAPRKTSHARPVGRGIQDDGRVPAAEARPRTRSRRCPAMVRKIQPVVRVRAAPTIRYSPASETESRPLRWHDLDWLTWTTSGPRPADHLECLAGHPRCLVDDPGWLANQREHSDMAAASGPSRHVHTQGSTRRSRRR